MSHLLPTISALGTSWWIEIFDELPHARYTVIHADCVAFLHTFEMRYSRFKPDSLLGKLNSTGHSINPDTEFRDMITYGIAQHARTGGIFNIMVGETLVQTGYTAEYSFSAATALGPIPNPNDIITITTDGITLTTGSIDLGGFGKGYAIDRIAELLQHTHGISYFLINGGGDMFCTSDHGTPITIYLEHPTEPNAYLETTTLMNQGFAASSPYKRSWTHNGKTYTHIVTTNPSLPMPVTAPDATFTKAATACDADIFATVALLVSVTHMDEFAETEQLGVASFYLESGTLIKNKAFM